MFVSLSPCKLLLVFKTPWRCLQDMSCRGVQYIFSITNPHLPSTISRLSKHTISRLPRRSQDVVSWLGGCRGSRKCMCVLCESLINTIKIERFWIPKTLPLLFCFLFFQVKKLLIILKLELESCKICVGVV